MTSLTKEKDLETSVAQEPDDVQDGKISYINDADVALDFLRSEGAAAPEMSPQDERRLRRKIDWMVMPLMWCCYCLQYLDKTLINYANVMGLEEDTGMTGNQFRYEDTTTKDMWFDISFVLSNSRCRLHFPYESEGFADKGDLSAANSP